VKRIVIFLLLPLVLGAALPAFAQVNQTAAVTKILTARGLFGKDFGAALASLPAWGRAKEASVAVFPDRVVGATPFKTAEAARPALAALGEALRQATPTAAAPFAALLKGVVGKPPPLKSDVIQSSDDASFRVALTGPEFLRRGLTVKEVEAAIGPPEAVTTQLIQSERDRRPVILTLHSYAGGAIVFAESDLAPRPGVVDRVILNVAAVSAVVFGGPQ
jgi:hypothetical protein